MSFHSIQSLDSASQSDRREAIAQLYVRHFETLRLTAFRALRKVGYQGDPFDTAQDMALAVFSETLEWALAGTWPRERQPDGSLANRTTSPWKTESDFLAYWKGALENRAKALNNKHISNEDSESQTMESAKPVAPEKAPRATLRSEQLAAICEAAQTRLVRQGRVIITIANYYDIYRDSWPMAEMYARAADELGLKPNYISNAWSEGLRIVKEITGDTHNKTAADRLALAAAHDAFQR